jgi:cell division protein ZapE
VIQGEADEIVDAAGGLRLDRHAGRKPAELVRMPDTSHFFHRKLIDLRGAVKHGVKRLACRRAAGRMSDHGATTPSQALRRRRGAQATGSDDPAQHPALRAAGSHPCRAAGAGAHPGVFGSGCSATRRRRCPTGLYLWGGVGRGKTFLVDLFYDRPADFPEQSAARTSTVSCATSTSACATCRRERSAGGDRARSGGKLAGAGAGRVLRHRHRRCDAAGRLLERMFAEGITLVTTSNTAPQNLYKDGLQRARFLPAIALLQPHCVVELRQTAPTTGCAR